MTLAAGILLTARRYLWLLRYARKGGPPPIQETVPQSALAVVEHSFLLQLARMAGVVEETSDGEAA